MSDAPDLSFLSKDEIKEALQPVRHPVSIAIYGSTNYFNGAAIIRSAHSFLVKEIIMVDVPLFYRKATMGTHKWENITHVTTEEFLSQYSDRSVIAMERRSDLDSKNLLFYSYPKNPILCFGSEKQGLPDSILNMAQDIVSIPQYGLVNSMNLANAASIVLYDWISKYHNVNNES